MAKKHWRKADERAEEVVKAQAAEEAKAEWRNENILNTATTKSAGTDTGEGVALTSVAHPDGLIDSIAGAILDGRLPGYKAPADPRTPGLDYALAWSGSQLHVEPIRILREEVLRLSARLEGIAGQ